jgi:hypothetical protein
MTEIALSNDTLSNQIVDLAAIKGMEEPSLKTEISNQNIPV